MPRYIDADAVMRLIPMEEFVARMAIANAPTADVVEVVRCKDCVKRNICRTTNIWAVPPRDDWFCADGKRRTEDAET